MIYIIRALQTREEYTRLTKVVEQVFPGAGNFKLPPGDDAVRITFAEGVKMLKEAGVEADEMADLRYALCFLIMFTNNHIRSPHLQCVHSSLFYLKCVLAMSSLSRPLLPFHHRSLRFSLDLPHFH